MMVPRWCDEKIGNGVQGLVGLRAGSEWPSVVLLIMHDGEESVGDRISSDTRTNPK